MLNFGSVVDAVIVKKNGGNKTVMSGNEVRAQDIAKIRLIVSSCIFTHLGISLASPRSKWQSPPKYETPN